jgi:hypothetical protein
MNTTIPFLTFLCLFITIRAWRAVERSRKPKLIRLPPNADQLRAKMTQEEFDAHMLKGYMES